MMASLREIREGKTPPKKKVATKKTAKKKRMTRVRRKKTSQALAESRGRGRPTDYREEYNELVYRLCLLGAIDSELADFFGIADSTLNNWKEAHPEFLESLKRGKIEADAMVAASLFHRALGYSHPEDKIFNQAGEPLIVPTIKHYPPDTTAAIFWLKNRQPDRWRDRQDVDHKEGGGVVISITDA